MDRFSQGGKRKANSLLHINTLMIRCMRVNESVKLTTGCAENSSGIVMMSALVAAEILVTSRFRLDNKWRNFLSALEFEPDLG